MSAQPEADAALVGPLPRRAAPGALLRAALRIGAYPLLLLAAALSFAATLRFGWAPTIVGPAFLFSTIGYLAAVERVIPYRRDWHPTARELGWYGVYFLLTISGAGAAQSAVLALAAAVAGPGLRLTLWLQVPAAVLLSSLGGYLVHRYAHTNRWLWRVHGIHHVPNKVNVANNGVNHILDVALKQGLVLLSLALIGFSAQCELAVGLFAIVQGYFIHANVEVRLGLLNHVLATPEQHRLHHSTVLSEAGHFGVDLSLWDRAFGSFTWRPGRRPAAVGVHDPSTFPDTGAIAAGLLHPWRNRTWTGR